MNSEPGGNRFLRAVVKGLGSKTKLQPVSQTLQHLAALAAQRECRAG